MNVDYYHEFRRLQDIGRKREATAALQRFIASFEPTDDRRQWVREFLESRDYGHRVRHELYEHLVFPVLLEGYNRRDAWSTFWLAQTAQNLHGCRTLHSQIDVKSERQLLKEAYRIEPSDEIRRSLLRSTLDWFGHCQHEWPAGILYGMDGANIVECEDILQEVAFARELDIEVNHARFLDEFKRRTREYIQRLQDYQ